MKKPRKCGTCSACCTTHGVTELEKPPATPCEKLCEKGCSIYGQHPQSCQDFKCLWLQGAFEGWQRPDRLGIVFDCTESNNDVISMVARECRKGAFWEPAGREVLNAYATRVPIVMFKVDGSRDRIIGPSHLINKVLGR